MLQQFNQLADNAWLHNLTKESIENGKLPIKAILADSCYYPASGLDGEIIRIATGNVFSFVYVDHSITKEQFLAEIESYQPLRGYRLLGGREVSEQELIEGAENHALPSDIEQFTKDNIHRASLQHGEPFAYWAVFERNLGGDESSRMPRISLLFIHADGVATYQRLYWGHNTAPAIINLHQPGHGFGGNWTNFFNEEEPLAQLVLRHPGKKLPYAIACGGMGDHFSYRDSCWKNSFCQELPSDLGTHTNHLFFIHKTNK